MPAVERHSGTSTSDVEIVRLFECKKCGERVSEAEKTTHRRFHKNQRRQGVSEHASIASSQVTLFRPVEVEDVEPPRKRPKRASTTAPAAASSSNRGLIKSNKEYNKSVKKVRNGSG